MLLRPRLVRLFRALVDLLLLAAVASGAYVALGPGECYAPAGAAEASRLSPAAVTKVKAGRDVTLKEHGIEIMFAKRLAGGVFSMKWNGQEFVEPVMGNGGSQQSAMSLDIPVGWGSEVENPTEAGNRNDNGGVTSSKWLETRVGRNSVYTKTQMAYYIRPGDVVDTSAVRTRARGISPVSPITLQKTVTVPGPSLVHYDITFTIPSAAHYFAQFEILCGHLPRAFDQIYLFKRATGEAVRFRGNNYPGRAENPEDPVIMTTAGGTHGIGVWCYAWPRDQADNRPSFYTGHPWYTADAKNPEGHLPWASKLEPWWRYKAGTVTRISKWNVVDQVGNQFHHDKPSAPRIRAGDYNFKVVLVVGNLDTCVQRLRQLTRLAPPQGGNFDLLQLL